MGWERRAALGVLFVHLALSPLIFSPVSADVFEYPKVMLSRAVAILLLGLGASWFAGQIRAGGGSRERWRFCLHRDPIAWGVLALLVSCGISTALSLSPRTSLIGTHESFLGLFHLLAWVVLFFATRATLTCLGEARWLLWATVVASTGVGAYAVIQATGTDPIAWTRTSGVLDYTRPFGTMGHPILLGGFLVTVFPICAYLAVSAWRRGRLACAAVAAAALLLGWAITAASLSRGAWLALGIAFCALVFGWARVGERPGARALLAGAIVALVLATVSLFALVEDTTTLRESAVARAESLFRPGQEPRLQIWRVASQMFIDHPISGVGVDAFQLAFERYRPATYWHFEWGGTPTRAHNEILHVAATQGALGLAALALLVGGLGMGWRRALRGARSLEEKSLLIAVGAGLIAFGTQSLFSFTVAGTGTLFVTYAAMLSRLSRVAPEQGGSNGAQGRHRSLPVILARVAVWGATLFALVYGVLIPVRANTLFQTGRVLRMQGAHDAAISYVDRALALDAGQQLYWTELSALHHVAGTREAAPDEKRAHLEQARRAVARAIELVPPDGYGHANRGLTLLALATLDPPAATSEQVFQAFDRALAIDETNAVFLVDAARAALTLEDLTRAQTYAGRSREHYPDYAPARLRLGTVFLRRSDWESAAAEFEAALDGNWRGAPDRAAAWKGLAQARLELGRPDESLEAAQEAITQAPEDAEAWRLHGATQEALELRSEALASY